MKEYQQISFHYCSSSCFLERARYAPAAASAITAITVPTPLSPVLGELALLFEELPDDLEPLPEELLLEDPPDEVLAVVVTEVVSVVDVSSAVVDVVSVVVVVSVVDVVVDVSVVEVVDAFTSSPPITPLLVDVVTSSLS